MFMNDENGAVLQMILELIKKKKIVIFESFVFCMTL